MAKGISNLLLDEVHRRLFDESYSRIETCMDMLTEAQLWFRPNEVSNSIGNLVLHLMGNVRQWIVSGLGRQEDIRQRDVEFQSDRSHDKVALQALMQEVKTEVEAVLENISLNQLETSYHIQGFDETGVSVLVHVVEHFSYHVGQITYITKMLAGKETGYYANHDL